jgi:hypothetical protein
MLLIWGIRRKAAVIALVRLACRNGHVAAHQLVKVTSWFTLFFIPLIPFRRKYRSVCSYCGLQLDVPKDQAEELAGAGSAGTPTGPPADPVAAPLDPRDVSAPAESELPPAGWYPDPAGSQGRRWWDGRQWTESVQAEAE